MEERLGDCSIPVNKDYSVNSDDSLIIRIILSTEEGYTLNQEVFEKIKDSGTRTYSNRFSITDKNGQTVYKSY